MAEAILYDLAAGLISKVGSLLLNEIVLLWGVEGELKKLEETVDTIKAVLLDAEEKSSHNHEVKQWLGKLSEAMYDAEDLLDEFSYEALHQQLMGGSKVSKKVGLFFSRSNQVAFGLKMAHKVKDLRERFSDIADLRHKFHLEASSERKAFVLPVRDPSHSSPPQVVIGREADKEEIVEHLLSSGSEDQNVSFISIHGIGGLGKTTLAQLVYNDDRVERFFELKIWVCVSDEFDVKLLVKKVMESATKQAPSCNEMEPLKNLLHEQIKGKRYLLVLDDVWNEDINKWLNFKELLVCGSKGSKVVVTTRFEKVADMSQPIHSHKVKGLVEDDAWSLFKKIAFVQGQPPNQSFENMGNKIVAKCCGVPLAIRTIGALLNGNDSLVEWRSFNDNELSKIDVFQTDILPILKLSYNHLPLHYKRCFAYCCLYPKDFRIPVDQLIQLWKAQGYLQLTRQSETLRDVGLKYFNELLRLSFFQDVRKDSLGNIEYCKMHDLMHDLAVSVAGDNVFVSAPCQITSIKSNIRHMSLGDASSLLKMKKLRTILQLKKDKSRVFGESKADALFRNLRCLRVLDLSNMGLCKLPNSVCKMKLLRNLDLSCNRDIEELPESLVSLHNLQGLNVDGCWNLKKWPSDMSKLVNLTDLNFDNCNGLNYLPSGIGKLTKLEKLSRFVIAKYQSISKHSARLDELHSLDNLRGELIIKNLRFVGNATSKFREGLLSSKKNLQKLMLDWDRHHYHDYIGDQEMVIEALCPHPNLKALEVYGYEGLKPPSWLPSIINLVEVKIKFCNSIRRLPPLDQLIHLKILEIAGMSELESIEVEYGGGSSSFFPSLTHLTLSSCPKLKGFERLSSLSDELELPCFPSLSNLSISASPNLIHLPLSAELNVLDLSGAKSLIEILKMPTNSALALSKLQELWISYMEDCTENELNDGLPWRSLEALQDVSFIRLDSMVSLPKGLKHATTLKRLHIFGCTKLKSIPEWMPNLIALQHLSIEYSSEVVERCEKSGEDWHKISHIPHIEIHDDIGYLL